MNIWSLVLLVAWGIAGGYILVCSIPKLHHRQVSCLFGISDKRGLFFMGLLFFAFSLLKLYQWQSSHNPFIIWSMQNGI